MSTFDAKILIVGAGLSGLTTARHLTQSGESNFLVVEARERIGGRIETHMGVDLGATWFHDHHAHLSSLVDELGIARFHQFNKGKNVLVYNSMSPAHFFESHPDAPSPYRIAGGSKALVQSLAKPISPKIKTGTQVLGITAGDDHLEVHTSKGMLTVEKIVLTIPPRILNKIEFIPSLPEPLRSSMAKTHTWMSNAIKVGIVYEEPFWRSKGLSGTIIGQVGPVIELYDHSDASDSHFCLMGFVNEGLRASSPKKRKDRILKYIEQYLGPEALGFASYFEKDWSQSTFTSGDSPLTTYISPEYGDPLFQQGHWDERLYFSGAETSILHGGYMDGAVISGLRTAKQLLSQE